MKPADITNQRVLLSPLNWGMGHVSRCISLIDQLIAQGNTIFLAVDESQRFVLEQYFTHVTFIDHLGYPFEFGGKGYFGWDLTKRFSKLNQRMREERAEVESYVSTHKIDVVLSDHRYGFFSLQVPSIFITHQYNLPSRWYEWSVASLHRRLMGLFSGVWVMDFEDARLAGKLSAGAKDKRATYIGPYSRFSRYEPLEKSIEEVLILSGPDVYAKQLLERFSNNDSMLIIGNRNVVTNTQSSIAAGDWLAQDRAILAAKKVISYAGYSTIMDLNVLQAESSLIPTRGQREQIYLAKRHGTSK